jgi:predicted nucleotidyltransferase component of viral defense system
MGKGTYTSAASFRIALEHRLLEYSRTHNVDIMKTRRQCAFDRFLSRVFLADKGNTFVLKGGYALELRIAMARTTKDIDLCVQKKKGLDTDLKSIRSTLMEAMITDINDFFEFHIGNPIMDLENAPYGGHRFPVTASLAGRLFIAFQIDVAIGDVWLDPHDNLLPYNWCEFAEIPVTTFSAISSEQQFAEKLHSYTLPRNKPNSRVKDLVDMLLIINNSTLDNDRIRLAIEKTFKLRNTHPIPSELDEPPDFWTERFRVLADSCRMETNIKSAFSILVSYWRKVQI